MPHATRLPIELDTAEPFWQFFEASPRSLQVFSPDGTCIRANRAWEQLWDAPAASVIGSNLLADVDMVRTGAIEYIRQAFSGTPVTLPPAFHDPAASGKPGRTRYVVGHLAPLATTAGTFVVLTLEDITATVRAERRADLLSGLAAAVSRAESLDEGSDGILTALARAVDACLAALWEVSPTGAHIRCVRTWMRPSAGAALCALEERTRAVAFDRGVGLPGHVWHSGEAAWVSDALTSGNFPRLAWAVTAGIRGGIAFPVVSLGEVTGVVELFTDRTMPADPDVAGLVEGAGRLIGEYLRRRRLEDELRESREATRAVLQTSLDAIVGMDISGAITEFNPAAEALFGWRREEVLGREMAATIVPPAFRDAHRAGLRRQRETGESNILSQRLELSAQRADGTVFPVELTITRTHHRGTAIFTGFIRDLTERRRYEIEREALLTRERVARDTAEAANRLKDEFIATISHELRTPLNAMRGWLQMLESGGLPPERVSTIIERVARNAEMQAKLVDDLLDVSALVTGRMRFTVGDVQIRELLENACEALRPAAEAKHLAIGIAGGEGLSIRGDALRLQQVFWNLFANAVKFTPAGGRVDVSVTLEPGELQVRVADTGPGIPEALLPSVFDKFRQGGHAEGGLGLGLAIVRHIVEAHGGTVGAMNRETGSGAIFTVTLPRA